MKSYGGLAEIALFTILVLSLPGVSELLKADDDNEEKDRKK